MTTLFVIFVVLVVFHFVIESIIAPSERSKIRLDLFALRDEVRMAKINHKNEFDNDLFDHLQDHTNKSIHLLHNYNIFGVVRAVQAERRDDDLFRKVRARMERFANLLENSKVPKVETMHQKSILYTFQGFVYNSLGWLPIVLIPIVLTGAILFATRMVQQVNAFIANLLAALLEMPEGEFRRHFPDTINGGRLNV